MTDWTELVEREIDLEAAGIERAQRDGFVKYLTLLHKWTSVTNLVASSTSPRDLVAYHLADCLALLPHLGVAQSVVDVGSGGGLPGAVLAIACPDLEVTALEPVHKKHAFLATLRRGLPLDNFTPLPERDDQHRAHADFRPYDLAISRAVFAVPEWLPRGANLVHPGGRVLAMEGREQHDLPTGATRHPYHLPDRERAIIVWPR